MAGVNYELAPVAAMSVPRRARGMTIDRAPIGEVAFRSVVLAGRVIPFDLHFLRLVEIRERGFLERSHSLHQAVWEHERSVDPLPGGCEVRDRLLIEPRLPGSAWLVRRVAGFAFRNRHRRLIERWGELA